VADGFLTGSPGDAVRIKRSVELTERLAPIIAAARGAGSRSSSSVWVKPTGTPTDGYYDGTFQQKDGADWITTSEDCYVREANGGKLKAGKVYLGRITGEDETDGLPLVEVVSSVATSEACFRSWLSLPECATLTVTEALGSCACIAGQTADLTNDGGVLSSEDRLYGCPPGVITTICADDGLNTGAPKKWNIPVSGFTGDYTHFNGSFTLTHTTGEVWVGTRGIVTVTATRTLFGWTLSLDDGTDTVTYDTEMAACCEAITFDLDDDGGTTGAPSTLEMSPASACGRGAAYTPSISVVNGDCGPCIKMVWTPVAGSGSRSIVFKMLECGTDDDDYSYIEFASNDPLLCTDDAEECGENVVVVRVTCAPCPPPECEACPDYEFSRYYCLTFSNAPDCTCLNGVTLLLTYQSGIWAGSVVTPCETGSELGHGVGDLIPLAVTMACTPGNIILSGQRSSTDAFPVNFSFCNWESTIPLDCESPFPVTVTGEQMGANFALCFTAGDCEAETPFTFDFTITEVSSPDDCEAYLYTPSYKCVPGTGCVEVFDGSGTSLEECQEECGGVGETCCDIQVGDPATLVIVGGADAGTYFVAWDNPWSGLGFPNWRRAYFVVGGSAYYVTCGGAAGVDGFAISGPGFATTEADSTACDPTAVVWNGLGTTTTITLS